MMNYIKSTSSEIELTNRTDLYPDMMLYSYLIRPSKGDVKHFYSDDKETLILLQEGSLTLKYEDKEATITRSNVFDDAPVGLQFNKQSQLKLLQMKIVNTYVSKQKMIKRIQPLYSIKIM